MFSLEENQRKWVNGNWEWENTINLFLLYISFSVEFSFGDDQQPNIQGNVFISSEMETRFFTENMNFLVWIIRIWSSAFHFPLLIGFGNGNEKCICNVLLLPRIHQFVQNLNGEMFLLRSVRCQNKWEWDASPIELMRKIFKIFPIVSVRVCYLNI